MYGLVWLPNWNTWSNCVINVLFISLSKSCTCIRNIMWFWVLHYNQAYVCSDYALKTLIWLEFRLYLICTFKSWILIDYGVLSLSVINCTITSYVHTMCSYTVDQCLLWAATYCITISLMLIFILLLNLTWQAISLS